MMNMSCDGGGRGFWYFSLYARFIIMFIDLVNKKLKLKIFPDSTLCMGLIISNLRIGLLEKDL